MELSLLTKENKLAIRRFILLILFLLLNSFWGYPLKLKRIIKPPSYWEDLSVSFFGYPLNILSQTLESYSRNDYYLAFLIIFLNGLIFVFLIYLVTFLLDRYRHHHKLSAVIKKRRWEMGIFFIFLLVFFGTMHLFGNFGMLAQPFNTFISILTILLIVLPIILFVKMFFIKPKNGKKVFDSHSKGDTKGKRGKKRKVKL